MKKFVERENVEYEVLFGSEQIVFIKSGAGGSMRGYKDKYYKIAQRVHERKGATVICASNPDTPHEAQDEAKIRSVVAEKGWSEFELYFIGTSDGAYHNLSLASRFPESVKIVGINTSYITVHDLQERFNALPDVSKLLIYGTKDEDFHEIVPTLQKMMCDKLSLQFVDGADHSFTGMVEEFVALADCLY